MIPKFRAWDNAVNKMWDVVTIYIKDEWIKVNDGSTYGITKDLVRDYVLMQATGLKDKNGNEIYEGDIVEFEDETSCYPFDDESSIGTINRAQIVIDNIQGVVLENFMLKNSTVAESYEDYYDLPTYEKAFFFTECRAIGNIYENPELLEDN
ncbi:YopX family protein [Staphylococcus epidermidis]|nr:YopX family protein [Staphylococcus epidermidis]MCG2359279.1 YopX family protein [Staphylococcus epidermidis]MCG2366240.1 YopX family protein [Staphylococcus epidermidis]MCG2370753.1 YopX family protein [Staphylococcus epidermidis]